MAKLVNDILPEVEAKTDGNYGGKKVYKVELTTAGDTFFLAYTDEQASKMADAIASELSDTIATAGELQEVYVQKGIGQE